MSACGPGGLVCGETDDAHADGCHCGECVGVVVYWGRNIWVDVWVMCRGQIEGYYFYYIPGMSILYTSILAHRTPVRLSSEERGLQIWV